MSKIAIIDYGSGNLRSVAKAFEHIVNELHKDNSANNKFEIIVTAKPQDLISATHIVLPGVGAFGDCMKGLSSASGMIDELSKQVLENKKYFLGICVGMQLMFERGLEHGNHQGLGWFKGEVVRLDFTARKESNQLKTPLKIPHIGWNELAIKRDHKIIKGIYSGEDVYFVHSYHALADDNDIIASTDYGGNIAAIIARENMVGMQFHPEKSQQVGLKLLTNFLLQGY